MIVNGHGTVLGIWKLGQGALGFESEGLPLFIPIVNPTLWDIITRVKSDEQTPVSKLEIYDIDSDTTTTFKLSRTTIRLIAQAGGTYWDITIPDADNNNSRTEDYQNILNVEAKKKEIRLSAGFSTDKDYENGIFIKLLTGWIFGVRESYGAKKSSIVLSGSDNKQRLIYADGSFNTAVSSWASQTIEEMLDNENLNCVIAIDDFYIDDVTYFNNTLLSTIEQILTKNKDVLIYADADGYIIITSANYQKDEDSLYRTLTSKDIHIFNKSSSNRDIVNSVTVQGTYTSGVSFNILRQDLDSIAKYGVRHFTITAPNAKTDAEAEEIADIAIEDSMIGLRYYEITLTGDPYMQPDTVIKLEENQRTNINTKITIKKLTVMLNPKSYSQILMGTGE